MALDPSALAQAADWLRAARRVVVFTGAGVSAESGIPTFRDAEGLWQRFPPERFATWRGLVRTALVAPGQLAEFLYEVLHPIAVAAPNAGHAAIARLEQFVDVTVVTQNIDALHQEEGSTTVLELHGSLFEVATRRGRVLRRLDRAALTAMADRLRRASRRRFALLRTLWTVRKLAGVGLRGIYRPNLVLFGDALCEPAWTHAHTACKQCDCCIQVGCSQAVLPAALLPWEAQSAGAKLIAVDPAASVADVWLQGTAAEVMPALVQAAFGATGNAQH